MQNSEEKTVASLNIKLEAERCVCETFQLFPRFTVNQHWGWWANILAITLFSKAISDFFLFRNIINRLKSQVAGKKLCSCLSKDAPWVTQARVGWERIRLKSKFARPVCCQLFCCLSVLMLFWTDLAFGNWVYVPVLLFCHLIFIFVLCFLIFFFSV